MSGQTLTVAVSSATSVSVLGGSGSDSQNNLGLQTDSKPSGTLFTTLNGNYVTYKHLFILVLQVSVLEDIVSLRFCIYTACVQMHQNVATGTERYFF